MAVSRQQKVAILNNLKENVLPQKAVMLITTKDADQSLDAQLNVKFRKEARSRGVVLNVVKNTLINKIFDVIPHKLTGPTYVASLKDKSESDEVTVPKIICEIVTSEFKENFNVVGSVVDGKYLNANETIILSKTPTKQESIASVAISMNNLISKIAVGVKEVPSGIVRGVSEYTKKIN